jgi:hypothetical protein
MHIKRLILPSALLAFMGIGAWLGVNSVHPQVAAPPISTIFALPTAAPVGSYAANIPFTTNLVAIGLATNPAVTVSFA